MPGPPTSSSESDARRLHAGDYVEQYGRAASSDRIVRLLPRMPISPGDAVVDIGCGDAQLAELLEGRVARYCGIDFSPDFIELGRRRVAERGLTGVELFCGSVAELAERRPAAFQVAFALDVSEHVPDDEWLEVLRSVRRLLAPGGRLVLHTPNEEFVVERMRARSIVLKPFPQHVAVRDPAANCALLERAGFAIEQCLSIPHYNVLRFLHPLSWLPGIGRHFVARLLIVAGSPA